MVEGLNSRGLRERVLRVALLGQQDRLKEWVGQCDVAALSTPSSIGENKISPGENKNSPTDENAALVDTVRETVLDLEDRINSAGLGALKVQTDFYTHPSTNTHILSAGDVQPETNPNPMRPRNSRAHPANPNTTHEVKHFANW